MQYMPPYSTHLPMLVASVLHTTGPVLELGPGLFSTPVLHAMCQNRELLSVENDAAWYQEVKRFSHGQHKVVLVEKWEDAPIDRPWDVALVDQVPPLRRKVDVARLRPFARLIVVHDTENRCYEYEPLLTTFKYRKEWQLYSPWTSVVSDVDDLEWLEDVARG